MDFLLCTEGMWAAAKGFGVAARRGGQPSGRGGAAQTLPPASPSFGRGGSCDAQGSVPEALQGFREAGSKQLSSTARPRNAPVGRHCAPEDTPWEPLWGAACNLVESLLLGVESHVPGAVEHVALAPDTAALRVRFRKGPIHGELATRSRLGVSVRLEQEVRAELRAPVHPEDPLVLSMSGLDFIPLSDVTSLRKRLEEELGAGFNKKSAYEWWERNKDAAFPLESSKLHRCWECLFGVRAVQLATGLEQRQDALWNYLHSVGFDVQSFEFRYDESHEVKMTGTQRPLSSSEHVERWRLSEMCDELCRTSLRDHGHNMQRFAPSAYHLLSLFYGPQVGGAGACPKRIAKLLSAASSWGPGDDGWQRWDRTWRCVDEQDWLMRVVKEQGRVIWQGDDSTGTAARAPAAFFPPGCMANEEARVSGGKSGTPESLVAGLMACRSEHGDDESVSVWLLRFWSLWWIGVVGF